MPVHKRKRNGTVNWYYKFNSVGATRDSRGIIRAFGFASKQAAVDAEAVRRLDEQKKQELASAGATKDVEVSKTLATLLSEFFQQHASENLAPKTVGRYREQAAYLSPALLAKPLAENTPLVRTYLCNDLMQASGRESTNLHRPPPIARSH
jgi:hypothetical protein